MPRSDDKIVGQFEPFTARVMGAQVSFIGGPEFDPPSTQTVGALNIAATRYWLTWD